MNTSASPKDTASMESIGNIHPSTQALVQSLVSGAFARIGLSAGVNADAAKDQASAQISALLYVFLASQVMLAVPKVLGFFLWLLSTEAPKLLATLLGFARNGRTPSKSVAKPNVVTVSVNSKDSESFAEFSMIQKEVLHSIRKEGAETEGGIRITAWEGLHVVITSHPIAVCDGVFYTCTMNHAQTQSMGDKKETLAISIEVVVSSYDTKDCLRAFHWLEKTREKYTDVKATKFNSKPHVLYLSHCPTYGTLSAVAYPMNSHKSFGNMIFDGKRELEKHLKIFHDVDHHKRLGIQRTLGLLIHGEPGTGKTSVIKALANELDRHLVVMPLRGIFDSMETLRLCLTTPSFLVRYEGVDFRINIPVEKRIIVFDDIDCGPWQHVVKSREDPDDADDEIDGKTQGTIRDLAERAATSTTHEEAKSFMRLIEVVRTKEAATSSPHENAASHKSTITLSDFLNVIDGVVELDGNIMIMTSNKPWTLDPALIRPGRIDAILHFGKLSKDSVCQMFGLWFGRDVDAEVKEAMADGTYTQAELKSLFSIGDEQIIQQMMSRNEQADTQRQKIARHVKAK